MNGAFKRHMGRFLAALMLMLLLCPAALADEQTADTWYFGGEGQDMVYNATPLPNGCLLLNGYTHPSRAGQAGTASRQTRAWLLCLNPDMSIAWEVIDTAEGTTRYVVPQVLPDGRISVLYYNSPSQVTEEVAIRYFTQDGEPAGETPLPAEPPFELPGDRCADGISSRSPTRAPCLPTKAGCTACRPSRRSPLSAKAPIRCWQPGTVRSSWAPDEARSAAPP